VTRDTPADVCVVAPTVRQPEFVRAYVRNAREHGFDVDRLHVLLVTEDSRDVDGMERMLADLGVSGAVFGGSARAAWLERHGVGEYRHLIPERSHAQTSFGLLYAWERGFPFVVFLDDDTRPHGDVDFFGTHLDNLAFEGTVEAVSSDESWVNVLHEADEDLYPRGYPYGAMDETVETEPTRVDDVVASQGLWTDVPDLDAVRILADGDVDGQGSVRTSADDFGEDFVPARGNYLTVCSMNLAFRREVIPAFYQLPMDDNPWGVGRFDDIWSGVFLKRAVDVVGGRIYNGEPLCAHEKVPRSTFGDLASEANGLELNEHLWRVVDDVGADRETYAGVFHAIATRLATGDFEDWENGAFLNHVGEYALDWLAVLAVLDDGAIDTAALEEATAQDATREDGTDPTTTAPAGGDD